MKCTLHLEHSAAQHEMTPSASVRPAGGGRDNDGCGCAADGGGGGEEEGVEVEQCLCPPFKGAQETGTPRKTD